MTEVPAPIPSALVTLAGLNTDGVPLVTHQEGCFSLLELLQVLHTPQFFSKSSYACLCSPLLGTLSPPLFTYLLPSLLIIIINDTNWPLGQLLL